MSEDSTKKFTAEQLAKLQAMVEAGGPEITVLLRSKDLARLEDVTVRLHDAGRLEEGAGRAEAVAAIFEAGLSALEEELD